MNPHYYYLAVDLACLSIPLLVSLSRYSPFIGKWKEIAISIALTMLFFIPWDIWFTKNGTWSFNEKYTLGWSPLGLPIEEWLFFIAIPFACLFTYACFRKYFDPPFRQSLLKYFHLFIMLVCVVLMAFFPGHAYTWYVSFFLFILVFIHLRKPKSWMGHFYLTYLVILIPFYVSNGILTGLDFWNYPLINNAPELIADQIVEYNNDENVGIRVWTVPTEDLFYGMLMILMTIGWYEYFAARKDKIVETVSNNTIAKS